MTISIRLDPETEALVRRMARSLKQNRSAVIRAAIHALAQAKEQETRPGRPYERIQHLIGVADSGGQQLSQDSGRKFRDLLMRRAHERRPR